jgi:hypothetical protein
MGRPQVRGVLFPGAVTVAVVVVVVVSVVVDVAVVVRQDVEVSASGVREAVRVRV